MNNTLEYLTVNQQIEKLKSQNLEFKDENFARKLLYYYGYYNIINGYREPYIYVDENGIKKYHSGISFEQIYNLFMFDSSIRNAVMMAMIDLEGHLKSVVADIIGSSFGVDHARYLKRTNYRDKIVSNPKFSRNEILYTLSKTALYSSMDPIKHYREKYGIVPPWILFKDTYFATIINLIRFFKAPQREQLVLRLYGNSVTADEMSAYKDLMSDTLFMCLDYRNRSAHGGRIYNYHPKSTLRPFLGKTAPVGLLQLAQALDCFVYDVPFSIVNDAISQALSIYCNNYPSHEDIERLEKATGFTIVEK